MFNKKTTVFSFSLLALMVSSAMAEQVVDSQISAVTVYPASATVTRTVTVDLPAGPQTVWIAGLPSTLDENTLRITGSGDKSALVASVELKNEVRSELVLPRAKELQDTLTAQQDQLALLQADELALNTQQTYLQKLAEHGGDAGADGKSQGGNAVGQWRTGWQTLGAGMKEIGAAKVALARDIRTLKQQIDVTQRELEQINNRQQDNKIAVVHLQSGGGKLAMKLSYQLSNAGWYPVYDANLDTQSGKLAVTQAAYVQQNSGENWENVALTLSTLQPSAAVEPPALSSWWIDYQQPVVARTMTKSAESLSDLAMPEMMAAAPVAEQQAAVQDSGYHVSYLIAGKVNLDSSEEKQRVVLQQLQWPVELSLQAAPRFDAHAYLYAKLQNPSTTPLLPGEWLLQRDGVRVGRIDQPLLSPKDQIAMGFGADDAVKLEWQTVKDQAGEAGVLNKQQTLQRHYQLKVTNGHNKPMTLTVLDNWPVSKQQDIKVSVLEGTAAPKEQNVNQQAGVQRWELSLPAGKPVTLDTGYQVTYPQDKQIDNL